MKILLDTHVFLWFITADRRMNPTVRDGLRDSTNSVFLSVVSVWEIIVKYRIGKLELPAPPDTYLRAQRVRHRIESLPLDEASVEHLSRIALIHRDPFDRMLVCQAIEHDMVLATEDHMLQAYTTAVDGTPWRKP
ncbi:MAG: type II toxin-antitoxin system VapC family toxin [Polyangiaceae bacterium]|nr:type II toxin-antitoxin system VapC family toxin [Polyangiaceae bacterium]